MGLLEVLAPVFASISGSISGLFDSMRQSKTLTVMVLVGAIGFSSFACFLYMMAVQQ